MAAASKPSKPSEAELAAAAAEKAEAEAVEKAASEKAEAELAAAEADKPAKKGQLRVVVPLVGAKVGNTVLHFYKGDILPEGTDKAAVANLKSLGFVEKA